MFNIFTECSIKIFLKIYKFLKTFKKHNYRYFINIYVRFFILRQNKLKTANTFSLDTLMSMLLYAYAITEKTSYLISMFVLHPRYR